MLPYVDAGTFALAPTGLDLSTLVPTGTEQDQTAALTQVLLRASRWVDNITQQRWGIAASTNQDPPVPVKASRDGSILYSPLTFPIVQVVSANWWCIQPGATPVVNAVNTELVTVLDRSILIADRDYSSSRALGASRLMVQLQYENGYAHTTVTCEATEGSSTVQVASTIGMAGSEAGLTTANQTPYLSILDGNASETIIVESISGNTLTLASALQYTHADGVIVTGIPWDVQQWTIALATDLIKTRDVGSLTMNEHGFDDADASVGQASPSLMKEARLGLKPYTREGGA